MTARAHAVPHVAGRGAVSCFGAGQRELSAAIFAGRSGVLPRRRLADVDCLTSVAAEVPEAVLRDVPSGEPLVLHLAVRAASEALEEAAVPVVRGLGLVLASTKADLAGVVGPGDGLGSPRRLLARLADRLGIDGPAAAVSCACASGLAALALAGRWIRAGRVERVLVVGVDVLNDFVLRGFSGLLALSPDRCRPFDHARVGLSLGEGAGAIVLSAHAGESVGARLLGWGASNDANHITGPCRDGSGLACALRRALSSAGLEPEAVDLAHLHGTGTDYNDAMEGRALRAVFPRGPVAAGSKAQIGHTLGAAGILESLIALEGLARAEAPPNVGLERRDPDIALDLEARPRPLARASTALKLAAGFGGINAALVFTT